MSREQEELKKEGGGRQKDISNTKTERKTVASGILGEETRETSWLKKAKMEPC